MTVLLFCTHQPKSENQTSDRLQSAPMILCLEAKEKSDQISVYRDVLLQNRKLLVSNPCSRITTSFNSPVSSRLPLTGPHWIPNPHPVPNRYYIPRRIPLVERGVYPFYLGVYPFSFSSNLSRHTENSEYFKDTFVVQLLSSHWLFLQHPC